MSCLRHPRTIRFFLVLSLSGLTSLPNVVDGGEVSADKLWPSHADAMNFRAPVVMGCAENSAVGRACGLSDERPFIDKLTSPRA